MTNLGFSYSNVQVEDAMKAVDGFYDNVLPDTYKRFFPNKMLAISAYLTYPNLDENNLQFLSQQVEVPPALPTFQNLEQWSKEFHRIYDSLADKQIPPLDRYYKNQYTSFYNIIESLTKYATENQAKHYREILLKPDYREYPHLVIMDMAKSILKTSDSQLKSNEQLLVHILNQQLRYTDGISWQPYVDISNSKYKGPYDDISTMRPSKNRVGYGDVHENRLYSPSIVELQEKSDRKYGKRYRSKRKTRGFGGSNSSSSSDNEGGDYRTTKKKRLRRRFKASGGYDDGDSPSGDLGSIDALKSKLHGLQNKILDYNKRLKADAQNAVTTMQSTLQNSLKDIKSDVNNQLKKTTQNLNTRLSEETKKLKEKVEKEGQKTKKSDTKNVNKSLNESNIKPLNKDRVDRTRSKVRYTGGSYRLSDSLPPSVQVPTQPPSLPQPPTPLSFTLNMAAAQPPSVTFNAPIGVDVKPSMSGIQSDPMMTGQTTSTGGLTSNQQGVTANQQGVDSQMEMDGQQMEGQRMGGQTVDTDGAGITNTYPNNQEMATLPAGWRRVGEDGPLLQNMGGYPPQPPAPTSIPSININNTLTPTFTNRPNVNTDVTADSNPNTNNSPEFSQANPSFASVSPEFQSNPNYTSTNNVPTNILPTSLPNQNFNSSKFIETTIASYPDSMDINRSAQTVFNRGSIPIMSYDTNLDTNPEDSVSNFGEMPNMNDLLGDYSLSQQLAYQYNRQAEAADKEKFGYGDDDSGVSSGMGSSFSGRSRVDAAMPSNLSTISEQSEADSFARVGAREFDNKPEEYQKTGIPPAQQMARLDEEEIRQNEKTEMEIQKKNITPPMREPARKRERSPSPIRTRERSPLRSPTANRKRSSSPNSSIVSLEPELKNWEINLQGSGLTKIDQNLISSDDSEGYETPDEPDEENPIMNPPLTLVDSPTLPERTPTPEQQTLETQPPPQLVVEPTPVVEQPTQQASEPAIITQPPQPTSTVEPEPQQPTIEPSRDIDNEDMSVEYQKNSRKIEADSESEEPPKKRTMPAVQILTSNEEILEDDEMQEKGDDEEDSGEGSEVCSEDDEKKDTSEKEESEEEDVPLEEPTPRRSFSTYTFKPEGLTASQAKYTIVLRDTKFGNITTCDSYTPYDDLKFTTVMPPLLINEKERTSAIKSRESLCRFFKNTRPSKIRANITSGIITYGKFNELDKMGFDIPLLNEDVYEPKLYIYWNFGNPEFPLDIPHICIFPNLKLYNDKLMMGPDYVEIYGYAEDHYEAFELLKKPPTTDSVDFDSLLLLDSRVIYTYVFTSEMNNKLYYIIMIPTVENTDRYLFARCPI